MTVPDQREEVMSTEENMLEVQRSLGRIEAGQEGLRRELHTRIDGIEKKLDDHIKSEDEFRQTVEAKALANKSNRAVILSGILGSGLFSALVTWLLTGHKPTP